MLHDEMVMGAVLIHCTGQTASFADSLRDKLVNWKLKTIGMNPATESFLILHRFGYVSQLFDLLSSEDEWEVTPPYLLMLTAKISVATTLAKIEVMRLSASNILFTAQLIHLLVVVAVAIPWSATAMSHTMMQTTPLNLSRRMSIEDCDKPMGSIQLAGGFSPNLAAPNDVAEKSSN
ncbi:Ndr [Echinococcus multilocularis]|uniref:Ndr n=1 Tax=Echinococcus multilocularis TaxID=6211 RepID=A0A068YB49_ECHMU|nr:Ndr [Echinococcus multilocularis]